MRSIALSLDFIDFLKEILPRIDFFAPVTGDQFARLLPFVLAQEFNSGEVVFKQGDPGDAFYVVFDGQVTLRAKAGWLKGDKVLARLVPSQYFGEMALVTGEPRMATAVCGEPSVLLRISAEDFKGVVEENAEVRAVVERVAAARRKLSPGGR